MNGMLWSIMVLRVQQHLSAVPPEKWDALRPHVEALYKAVLEEIKTQGNSPSQPERAQPA